MVQGVPDLLHDPAAHLCHYTRADTAFGLIVPQGQLLMDPYRRMRDPLENKPLAVRGSIGTVGPRLHEEVDALHEDVANAISAARDPMRLLCLTAGDDHQRDPMGSHDIGARCAWAHSRMWEQYADNHMGVCLLFDRAKMLAEIRQSLGSRGHYWEGAVEYTPTGFAGSAAALLDLDDFAAASLDDDVARHVRGHHRDFFFLKTEDWAAEHEYRFVFHQVSTTRARDEQFFACFGDALSYVIVGEKFPAWQLPGAREVASAAAADIRRMEWRSGGPWLAAEP